MAWDQQAYYQDPYQQYGQDQYYDPYGYGYDPYGYGYQDQPQEDTESEKLRKDQEEKERIEALESNRLYLKKINKRCVKEDFAELDSLQLFLFEVLVEGMEVDSESVLGLAPEGDHVTCFISARVQFLNSPWMEICERDMKDWLQLLEVTTHEPETEYMQTLGGAGYNPPTGTSSKPSLTPRTSGESAKERGEDGGEGEEEVKFTTKWENASGKSCLFSETPLTVIHDLEHFPVALQVLRCAVAPDSSETCEPLGYAHLRLPDHFSLSVIQSSKEGVILPVSCVHRETLDIRNVFGVKKGQVDLFLRLSCFGPAIITSFHSSGPDRKYVFKPSPLDKSFATSVKDDPPRSELLKPIIAEEQGTVGITVQKDYDFFQKPVLWKKTDYSFNCGCKDGNGSDEQRVSQLSSVGSLRLPLSSDISLCKNVLPPSVFRKLKFDQPTCDWHSLVGSGIKNNPGGNCGCLDSPKKEKGFGSMDEKLSDASFLSVVNVKKKLVRASKPSSARNVSRVCKMSLKTVNSPMVNEFGLPKECTDCGCDCPTIKDALENNKLFLI